MIVPVIDVLRRVNLQIVTMPIQSQRIITRDNVSVDVSAVAYFRVTDAVKSVVAIADVYSAINQIAQTTLRKVVGQHTLDQTLSETDKITAVVFPAPLMSTIAELGAFLARENASALAPGDLTSSPLSAADVALAAPHNGAFGAPLI